MNSIDPKSYSKYIGTLVLYLFEVALFTGFIIDIDGERCWVLRTMNKGDNFSTVHSSVLVPMILLKETMTKEAYKQLELLWNMNTDFCKTYKIAV